MMSFRDRIVAGSDSRQSIGEFHDRQAYSHTKAMLTDAVRSYTRAFPQGIPGVPSAEGIKYILEHELHIPLKLDKPLAAENFFDLRIAEEVCKRFEAKGIIR